MNEMDKLKERLDATLFSPSRMKKLGISLLKYIEIKGIKFPVSDVLMCRAMGEIILSSIDEFTLQIEGDFKLRFTKEGRERLKDEYGSHFNQVFKGSKKEFNNHEHE